MEISWSFNWKFGGEVTPAMPDLIAFDEQVLTHAIEENLVLLEHPKSGRKTLLQGNLRPLLESCKTFRTLEAQVSQLIRQFPHLQDQAQEVRQMLQSLQDAGMLLSAQDFCDGIRPQPLEEVGDELIGAALTCNRPQALRRLLISIREGNGNLDRLWVLDDSRDTAQRRENAQVVEELESGFPVPIHYFGLESQRAWIATLVEELPQEEAAIRFLLDPDRWAPYPSYGRVRNLGLLLSAGHRLIFFDDDALNQLYESPFQTSGLVFSTATREAEFFGAHRDWEKFRCDDGQDAIDLHNRFIGLSLGQLLTVLGIDRLQPDQLRDFAPDALLPIHEHSRILTHALGTFGDPGTVHLRWLFFLPPDSRQRLLRDGEKLRQAMTYRRSWLGRTRPTLIPRFNLSQISGLDNRAQLPPYFPAFRGEDRLFGHMVQFLYPDSLCLEQARSIPHLPIPERMPTPEQLHPLAPEGFPQLFTDYIGSLKKHHQAAALSARYAGLAQIFSELAGSTVTRLKQLHFSLRTANQVWMAKHLRSLLQTDREAPPEWIHRVQQGIEENRRCFLQAWQENSPISAVPEGLEEADLFSFWQQSWELFSRAIRIWPKLRKVAEAHRYTSR